MSLPRLDYDPREGRDPEVSAPIEWFGSLGCWCAFDGKVISTILKSSNFVAADFAERYRNLEQKVGIDCSALVHALHYIATANEGSRHTEIRRDLARVITANTRAVKAHTAKAAREAVSETCRAGARVDLAQEILRPVCDALLEALIGIKPSAAWGSGISASQIFDLYLGLNRRREINAKACAMLQAFSSASDDLKTSPEYAVALSMLGYDSVVASLGSSLVYVLREGAGKRLCDLDFSRSLPMTGVPYVERFAKLDCSVANTKIREGDRVRLYLDGGASGNAANEDRPYFGKGRHSCLGEELSTWVWQTLSAELSRLPLTCTIERVVRRKPDWVFVYYSSIEARFDA